MYKRQVVCSVNKIYNEDTLKAQGKLDDMTFDEFAVQNSERKKIDVDEDLYPMVANATGIPQENISIVAYEVPFFEHSDDSGRTFSDYLQIALAVLIFALLGFVVFRSTRKDPTQEIEPELSVETLLETTKEAELEDIGLNEKSETRILIAVSYTHLGRDTFRTAAKDNAKTILFSGKKPDHQRTCRSGSDRRGKEKKRLTHHGRARLRTGKRYLCLSGKDNRCIELRL